jgi:hypothetical protein
LFIDSAAATSFFLLLAKHNCRSAQRIAKKKKKQRQTSLKSLFKFTRACAWGEWNQVVYGVGRVYDNDEITLVQEMTRKSIMSKKINN